MRSKIHKKDTPPSNNVVEKRQSSRNTLCQSTKKKGRELSSQKYNRVTKKVWDIECL